MIFLGALTVLNISCTMPFVNSCRNLAQDPKEEWGYSAEQAKAACEDANRFLAGKFDADKGIWEIDYTKILTLEDVAKYLKDQLASIDVMLSYKHDDLAREIDFFKGLRPGLEGEEKNLKWVLQRINYFINYNEFAEAVGESPANKEILGKLMPYGRKAYSLRLLYPIYDLKKLTFAADYVESAKKAGILKQVSEFPIVKKKEFAEKIINKDDPNKFTWKKHYRGWLIKGYKIVPGGETPANPNVDYLEIYKAKFSDADAKFEGYEKDFVVSGFKSKGKGAVDLFVINYNLDGLKEFTPDKIFSTLVEVVYGDEIYVNESLRQEILEVLYDPPVAQVKEYRKKPPEKPLYIEIAKMGEVNVEMWENGTFSVPFGYSDKGPAKFHTKLDIKWVVPKDPKMEDEGGLKRIEFFKIKYSIGGNIKVVEYYAPKSEFAEKNIKEGRVGYDTFVIRRVGFPENSADVKFFADKIRMIDYEYGGRWYRILDKDGDGVFEKMRKIANPSSE